MSMRQPRRRWETCMRKTLKGFKAPAHSWCPTHLLRIEMRLLTSVRLLLLLCAAAHVHPLPQHAAALLH